jgi:hypothetical protein
MYRPCIIVLVNLKVAFKCPLFDFVPDYDHADSSRSFSNRLYVIFDLDYDHTSTSRSYPKVGLGVGAESADPEPCNH